VGTPWFRIAIAGQLTYGVIYLSSSVFQAAGQAVPTLLMSVAQGPFYIPAVVLGNLWFGVWGVSSALPVSEVGTAILRLALYLATRKGLQRLLSAPSRRARAAGASSPRTSAPPRPRRPRHRLDGAAFAPLLPRPLLGHRVRCRCGRGRAGGEGYPSL